MLNRTVLIGRLVRDPELRYSSTGVAIASFTLAVNRPYDREKTDFIRCISFKKKAENLANYQKKGSLIGLDGRIQTGSYEKDGKTIYTTDIVADQISFLESKGKSDNKPQGKPQASDPFKGQAEAIDIDDDSLPF